jgi:hypothetical protein
MSAVDVVYLKNVLLKFIAAQSAGKTQVCRATTLFAAHTLPDVSAAQRLPSHLKLPMCCSGFQC